ncbi:hypothetical protein BDN67DRAFT_879550, partial [Paxillus ammoniavirescens]
AGEEDDLVGCVRLDELEARDVERLVGEGRGQCTLDVVEVDEQAVDLDVARAAAADSNGAVSLHAANVVGVEEHVFVSPWAEHVFGCLLVVKVVGCALAGDESDNASGAFLALGNDGERLVEKDEIGATLCGTEGDHGWHRVGGTDEHL